MFKSILVIEDEDDVRELIISKLRRSGIKETILEASDPLRGLEIFNKHKNNIGVVITDQYMPSANGSEICELIKNERPAIRIFIFTGDRGLNKAQDGLFHIDQIFYKPEGLDELLDIINEDGLDIHVKKENNSLRKSENEYQKRQLERSMSEKTRTCLFSPYDENDFDFVPFAGIVIDESVSGMGCLSVINHVLKVGHLVKIHLFYLDNLDSTGKNNVKASEIISCLGEVVWIKLIDSSTMKVGVRFVPWPSSLA